MAREQVDALYRHWIETDQCVFYSDDSDIVAVGDHMVKTCTGPISGPLARIACLAGATGRDRN